MDVRTTEVVSVLTRAGGWLRAVCSHSLQPYRGCPLGASLCGVGCYVRHCGHILQGRRWGEFLEVRENVADSYRAGYARERSWARSRLGSFTVFLSSATEPFPPQEERYGVTRSVLEAMCADPPDGLIVQSHSPRVAGAADVLARLAEVCQVRVHLSIETDRERLPGLPAPASLPARRFEAARRLREAGLRVVITVSPLLPIADPEAFFAEVARSADAVVLDHFIGGDGTPGGTGARTRRTALPAAMAAVDPDSVTIDYRDRMAAVGRRHLPGRVGLGCAGFAGRFD